MTDRNVTIEGSDGATIETTIEEAIYRGLITEARAGELAARDLLGDLFDAPERFAGPLAHLPGAVSADERARRRADDEAALQEAEGRPELYRG